MQDNEKFELNNRLEEAFSENQRLQDEYGNYAPIFNSNLMLSKIHMHLDDINYLRKNIKKLNVGLLAAKALDFDDKFTTYASSLHDVWYTVLHFIGQPFQTPTAGDPLKAYNFYRFHGYNRKKTANHMSGINFQYSIDDKFILRKHKVVVQWRNIAIIAQGDYYAEKGGINTPDCLGINPKQEDYQGSQGNRQKHQFILNKSVRILKSIAAGVLDTWSVKGDPHQTQGGCVQYFNRNDKLYFNPKTKP